MPGPGTMCLTSVSVFCKLPRMETRARYRTALMLALSATFAMPLNAQSDMEDDPFFKAMKQDEMNKLRKAAAERAFKGAAVATTDEVSLTAVPAQIPNA